MLQAQHPVRMALLFPLLKTNSTEGASGHHHGHPGPGSPDSVILRRQNAHPKTGSENPPVFHYLNIFSSCIWNNPDLPTRMHCVKKSRRYADSVELLVHKGKNI